MTKTMHIEGMMCGHCEARVKKTLEGISGVKSAVVNFMTQKMTVEFAGGQDEAAVMKKVVKNCKDVEDDCEIYL